MAGIKSLAIRGIRSFGPDDNDEQRIFFEKPLTLILGQNGCGKTTIIECIRYAVTGQTPPGSRNELFVHDTKVFQSSEVLGQVKLKIVNANDKLLEIARSMKVTALPKKKPKFQTLDSFLSLIDSDGRPKDISSRCADLDFMVQEELGISKAILNSVIFCHQEDSGWPLDEGKKVKERFDEIFDADKYSDCFDKLKKMRKEMMHEINILVVNVKHLTEKKEEVDKKKLEMVNAESQISEFEIKKGELAREMKPVQDKINDIMRLEKNLVAFETKKQTIKAKLDVKKTQGQEISKSIKTKYEGSTEELDKEIKNYKSNIEAKQKERTMSHEKIHSLNKDEEKIANEMSSNETKFNRLTMLEGQYQEKLDKRNKMVVETAKLADLELEEIDTNEQATEGINTITTKIKSLHLELKNERSQTDSQEKTLQSAVDGCRDALSRHKQMIVSKETEIKKTKNEVTKLNKEIDNANKSKLKLEEVEKKYNAAEAEYETVKAELDVEELQKNINEEEKARDEHESELDNIESKITKLEKQSAKLKEKEQIEEQLKNKEKEFSVLKNKHRSTLTELLGQMPEKDFKISLKKIENEVSADVDNIKKKLKEHEKKVTRLESDRKHVRDSINDKREELTKAEDQMYKACGTQTYENTLTKLNSTVEKLQEEQNLLQSSLLIFSKYKQQLKDNNSCPLCNRGFDAQSEVTDLISDLTTKVINVPAKLEKATEELQRASAKKDELLSLKVVSEKINKLKEIDIPQLEKKLADVDKDIADLRETIEDLNMSVAEPEQKLQNIKQIQGDMPLLDRFTNEIQAASKNFQKIQSQCTDFDTETNLDDAIAKKNDLKSKISTLRIHTKESVATLNKHNKKLHGIMESRNKLKEEMLNIQKKVQEIVSLQETLKQLEENIIKFENELIELKDGLKPLEEQLKEKQAAKDEAVQKNRSILDEKRSYISKIENSFEKIKTILKEIKQHEDKKVPQELKSIETANNKLMEKMKQIASERSNISKRFETLKDELAKGETIKRDLEDNFLLRKIETECTNLEKELDDLNMSMSGVDIDSIPQKESLIIKQTKMFEEKAQIEGQLKVLKETLKQTKLDLANKKNKNVEQDYREKFYELEIMRALENDIKEYAVALEKCVMEFHREKMENINLIIRELWRKIYKGNDIDYIEIKTEGSMTADSERRKYDYRVVQCKNGVEIDMRGRCSAGQKVLACLIIRLALAETFSSRFGILALDEPTTNLDQDNVRSLCLALGEIVQERMRQKNFMFIIITHDKDFIDSLGSIDKVSHYYEVSRNKEGKSRIKRNKFT